MAGGYLGPGFVEQERNLGNRLREGSHVPRHLNRPFVGNVYVRVRTVSQLGNAGPLFTDDCAELTTRDEHCHAEGIRVLWILPPVCGKLPCHSNDGLCHRVRRTRDGSHSVLRPLHIIGQRYSCPAICLHFLNCAAPSSDDDACGGARHKDLHRPRGRLGHMILKGRRRDHIPLHSTRIRVRVRRHRALGPSSLADVPIKTVGWI
mmetsp:Transcript_15457/g.38048  ORF Transcript_15457/g.38048 Transcript_15457/m.38048 type:complete len:205 (-) Transcript_15457:1068-1682(-)